MGSEVVIFLESFLEFEAHFGDGVDYEGGSPLELFSKCSVSPLNASVVFWSGGQEEEETDVEFGSGLFELAHEPGSAVDLHGFDLEWRSFDELQGEFPCGCAFGVEAYLACFLFLLFPLRVMPVCVPGAVDGRGWFFP